MTAGVMTHGTEGLPRPRGVAATLASGMLICPKCRTTYSSSLVGGDLSTHKLSREGALDVLEALRFTQQILRSLGEAHKKSIVHRDLKPDNVFVADTPGFARASEDAHRPHDAKVIKLLDFGIA